MSQQPSLLETLHRAVSFLERYGTRCAVVGAVAVGARTEPRFTRDVDFVVSVASDREAEQVLGFLLRNGYELRELFQHEQTQEIVTARLVHSDDPDVITDLLFQTSGIESEVVAGSEVVNVSPDQPVNVAQVGHLIAMKIFSRSEERPYDQADLIHLMKVATSDDLKLAEEAVKLIEQRKQPEDRNLLEELRELRKGFWRGQEPG